MANIRIAVLARNAMLDALVARFGATATLKVYTGVQPANADAALSGNTLLGTLTFAATAAPAASGGVITFAAIASDISGDAAGTATFARIQDGSGNAIFDGDVNTSGALINFNRTDFAVGSPINITSFTITLPASIAF